MSLYAQTAWLFILAMPIACISWTVTHEEVVREPREYCINRSKYGKTIWERKFFYLFTCPYCFSHYVTILFLFFTRYKLLANDWVGYVIAGFSLVWIANAYMNLYSLLCQGITMEKTKIKIIEKDTHG